MDDDAFSVQAAMNAAKKVDAKNLLLTDALATLAERVLIYAMLGRQITQSTEWPNIKNMVAKALRTSTDAYALRVAKELEGEK